REQLQNDRGRLASLDALQEAALGKSSSEVNRWLAEQSLSERPRLAQSVVAERGFERAVETVLGAYLQAVTVESLDPVADGLPELTDGGVVLVENTAAANPAAPPGSLLAHVRGPAAVAALL